MNENDMNENNMNENNMYNDYLLALTIFLSLGQILENTEDKEKIPYGIQFGINEGMKLVEHFREIKK